MGNFYVLNGLVVYLADIIFTSEAKTVDGKRFRKDGRTRTIFENGTAWEGMKNEKGKLSTVGVISIIR